MIVVFHILQNSFYLAKSQMLLKISFNWDIRPMFKKGKHLLSQNKCSPKYLKYSKEECALRQWPILGVSGGWLSFYLLLTLYALKQQKSWLLGFLNDAIQYGQKFLKGKGTVFLNLSARSLSFYGISTKLNALQWPGFLKYHVF